MSCVIIFIVLNSLFQDFYCDTLLEKAKVAIANQKLQEALSLYNTAIQQDEKNPLIYLLRGLLNELLGKRVQAIEDFTRALLIDPNLTKARLSRALLLTKLGDFKPALDDLSYLQKSHSKEIRAEVDACNEKIKTLTKKYEEINNLLKKHKFKEAFETSQTITEHVPFDVEFRKKRVEILENTKNNDSLITEIDLLSRLTPNDLDLLFKLATIYFIKNLFTDAMTQTKRCLKSDPENSKCQSLFKKIRKIKKLNSDLDEAMKNEDYDFVIKNVNSLLEQVGDSQPQIARAKSLLCRAHQKIGELDEALPYCSFAIQADPEDFEALLARAEIYVAKERFEDAKSDYNAILEKDSRNDKAREGLGKVERLLKSQKRRNYYEILGVSKRATNKQIQEAYRILVKKWHPDHIRDPEEMKIAQVKLRDINDARTVLSNPEKRKRFDEGFDPLDPEDHGQDGGGEEYFHDQGNSFFNFFQGQNNFGGGGFRFTFG